jgi:hypothetical protein
METRELGIAGGLQGVGRGTNGSNQDLGPCIRTQDPSQSMEMDMTWGIGMGTVHGEFIGTWE